MKQLSSWLGSQKGAQAGLVCPPVLTEAPAGSPPSNGAQLSLPRPFGQKENNTVMLAGISFSSRLWFSQLSFVDFKASHVTGLCKYDGKQEGKSASQTQ